MKNNSQTLKKTEGALEPETSLAEIIPFPRQTKLRMKRAPRKAKIKGAYLFYKGRKIPIAQFQKSGYDRLLKLLVKEIG